MRSRLRFMEIGEESHGYSSKRRAENGQAMHIRTTSWTTLFKRSADELAFGGEVLEAATRPAGSASADGYHDGYWRSEIGPGTLMMAFTTRPQEEVDFRGAAISERGLKTLPIRRWRQPCRRSLSLLSCAF